MPVSAASALNVAGTDTDARDFTTASWTPTAGKIYLVAFAVHDLGGSPLVPSISGNNITWSRVGNDVGGGTTQPSMAVWAGYADSSASAGAITFSGAVPSGQTADGAVWGVAELTDVARGADLGMVQSAVASTTADTVTATLGAFASSSNATGGWFLSYDNAGGTLTNTAGSGFAIVSGLNAQQASGGDTMRLSFEFRNDNDTSIDGSASAANDRMLMHAVEIRAVTSRSGSGAVAGDGQVSGSGSATRSRTGSVAGDGAVSASGLAVRGRAGALAGAGAVSASAVAVRLGAGAVAGDGQIVGSGVVARVGSATLAGSGAVSGSGVAVRAAGGAVAGTGTVEAAGVRVAAGAATVVGDGSVSGSGLRTALGQAVVAGTGTISASSDVAKTGQAAIAGSGAVTATGSRLMSGGAELAGSGALSATGGEPGAATIVGAGTVSASGSAIRSAAGLLAGSGAVAAGGSTIRSGAGLLDGSGTISAGGGLPLPPASSWHPKPKPLGPLYRQRTRFVISVRVIVGPATVQLPVATPAVRSHFEVVARAVCWGTLVECRAAPVRAVSACVVRSGRRVETRAACSAVQRVWRPKAARWIHQQRLVGAVAAAISEVTNAPE